MPDQEDGNTYVELAKINERSIEKRKSVEWKVAFGLWVGIAVFTWFMTQRQFVDPDSDRLWLGIALLGVFAVWVFGWQFPLHRSHKLDHDWMHYYKDRAEELSSDRPKGRSYWDPGKRPWFWGQVLMTALFLLLAYGVILRTNAPSTVRNPGVDRLSGDNLHIVLEKLPSATQPANP